MGKVRKTSSARLGLVPNMIVLWNIIYMEPVVTQSRSERFRVKIDDVARLSPMSPDHINLQGRYSFALPDAVARGELRPFRRPNEA